ncbi:Isochorismatase hydrolase [Auriscalpium vulgare]|uniref:Isochorismatase hydrolase n=1 Tax=Auriscalpium vulgare TaxID=40419 RepID=A0ACB8S7I2_9AGAM|nr:Isochorismatase hydrolase [Auriscalpium vulgare]
MNPPVVKVSSKETVFFVCDVQTKFRPAIYEFESLLLTARKMLRAAKILEIPVVYTEQNSRALGPTAPELLPEPFNLGDLYLGTIEKTLFSMATPDVLSILNKHGLTQIVLFGIESHVCVLQSALDLLDRGYRVHVIADGVSSCNPGEISIALERMRQAGAQITTSESLLFQLQADSSKSNFKAFSAIIKDEKESTRASMQKLIRSAL